MTITIGCNFQIPADITQYRVQINSLDAIEWGVLNNSYKINICILVVIIKSLQISLGTEFN